MQACWQKWNAPPAKRSFQEIMTANIILKGIGNVFVRCVKKHSTIKLNLRGTETKSMQANSSVTFVRKCLLRTEIFLDTSKHINELN